MFGLLYTGCKSTEQGQLLKLLFYTTTFRVQVITDVVTVELCGALKVIDQLHVRHEEFNHLLIERDVTPGLPRIVQAL